jgi:hypothetical protein
MNFDYTKELSKKANCFLDSSFVNQAVFPLHANYCKPQADRRADKLDFTVLGLLLFFSPALARQQSR